MDYFTIGKEQLGKKDAPLQAKIPIVTLGSAGEVFYELALDMVTTIAAHNANGEKTVCICPVGPVGQYPIFVRLVNERNLSLKNTWFINMDEYLGDDKKWIAEDHKLSFRGFMNRNVYSKIRADLVMPENQRIFPDPEHPNKIMELIEKLGGVDVCYGGIGITGHVAFNEPEDVSAAEFAQRTTRMLQISPETRAVNAIGDLHGAVNAMPHWCVTVGMKEILAAKRIRLYCFREWHRAVVRQAAYGTPGGNFPVTLLQNHPDASITVTDTVAEAAY